MLKADTAAEEQQFFMPRILRQPTLEATPKSAQSRHTASFCAQPPPSCNPCTLFNPFNSPPGHLAYPGFNWPDCKPIKGDFVGHPVAWKANLGALTGQRVAFEFNLKRARLYVFDLAR